MKKCPSCGKEIQDAAIKCWHCKELLTPEKVDEIKKDSLEDNNIEEEYKVINPQPTHQNKRFFNLLIDFAAAFAFSYACAYGIGIILVSSGVLLQNMDKASIDILDRVLGYVFMLIYYVTCESIWGKTLGKVITKTKVVTKEGEKPTFGNVVGRSLCRFIPFEALTFLGSHYPEGWHDSISKTMVVDEHPTPEMDIQRQEYFEKKKGNPKAPKQCPSCGKHYDGSWEVCLSCNEKLVEKSSEESK